MSDAQYIFQERMIDLSHLDLFLLLGSIYYGLQMTIFNALPRKICSFFLCNESYSMTVWKVTKIFFNIGTVIEHEKGTCTLLRFNPFDFVLTIRCWHGNYYWLVFENTKVHELHCVSLRIHYFHTKCVCEHRVVPWIVDTLHINE